LEVFRHAEVPVCNVPFLEGLHEILEGSLVGEAVFSSLKLGFLIAYRTGHGQEGSAREIRQRQFFEIRILASFVPLFFSGFGNCSFDFFGWRPA
jgi:hypothetical protein